MANVTQVAFQIDDESLVAVDAIAARSGQSRAEVMRTAVRELLARRREQEIDAQLEAGYAAAPQVAGEVELAEVSIEGLRAADLDW